MFALLLITFVNFVGIGALIPILPYTVIENLGYSETVMTALLASFALAFFCLNLAFAQVEASYVLLVRDLLDFGPRQTGWLFTYIGVCIIIVQGGLIGKLTNAFGELRVVVAGVTVLAAGQLVTTIIAGGASPFGNSVFLAILVSTSFVCVGFALTNPTLSAASSYAAHSGQMGGALGLYRGLAQWGR